MNGWKSRAFAVTRLALALLLVAAAALKIYGWSVSTIPPLGWFSTPSVQAAAIGWEIFLGVWLLSAMLSIGSWIAALGTFMLLASISGYLGWIGQARCNCFGAIAASPWHAFGVDVAALGLLAIGQPSWQTIKRAPRGGIWRSASGAGYFVLGVGVVVATLVGIGGWVYGSPEIALARLRGDSLTITPGYVDFGVGKPGERLEATVEIRNWTDRSIRVIGGTSDCSCVTTHGLPITIPTGEARAILVRLRVRQSQPGIFTRMAMLWTDCEKQRTIRFRVGCRVE